MIMMLANAAHRSTSNPLRMRVTGVNAAVVFIVYLISIVRERSMTKVCMSERLQKSKLEDSGTGEGLLSSVMTRLE